MNKNNNPNLDINQWETFIRNHSNGNVFQTPDFYFLYKKVEYFNPLLTYTLDEKGNITGILLALIQQEGKGLLGELTSRAIVWGGPLIKDNDVNILNEILQKYKQKIANKVIYTQFRNLWFWNDEHKSIFLKHGFTWEGHLDLLHDLTIKLEEQFKKIHSGRRKNINRAVKYGVNFLCINNNEEDFDKALNLVNETYKRVHLPLPEKSFFYTSREILDTSILKVFIATYKDEIIGTRMVLCYNGLIYDWYAGASQSHLDKYPNDYLPWKIMEWGTKNNFSVFDFGGAGKPNVPYGVRDYKLKFGGELINPGRFIFIHKPLFYKLGILGLKLFKLIKK